MALCCHYRYAVSSAMVGLPEVKLGLIPGAGGTQRLPRLVGAEKALDFITSGSFIPAPKARALGIVDEVGDGDLLDGAVAYAEKLVAEGAPTRKIRDMKVEADPAVFEAYRKKIARSARGFLAPWACIDAVEVACGTDMDEGLKREREIFQKVHDSSHSTAQRHIFFAEREASKVPDVPKGTPVRSLAKGAVIGFGTMGGGIAMNFANAGIDVTVLEMGQEALDRGMGIVTRNYQNTVNKGRLSQEEMDKRVGRISLTTDFADLADADLPGREPRPAHAVRTGRSAGTVSGGPPVVPERMSYKVSFIVYRGILQRADVELWGYYVAPRHQSRCSHPT